MATIQKSNAVQFGWGNVKSDLRFFIIITLIYVAILVIVGAIFDNLMSIKMNGNTKISFNVVSWVINSILTIGFMKISLNYVDNKKSKLFLNKILIKLIFFLLDNEKNIKIFKN